MIYSAVILPQTQKKINILKNKKVDKLFTKPIDLWQGRHESNAQPTVLETAALPIELLPYND